MSEEQAYREAITKYYAVEPAKAAGSGVFQGMLFSLGGTAIGNIRKGSLESPEIGDSTNSRGTAMRREIDVELLSDTYVGAIVKSVDQVEATDYNEGIKITGGAGDAESDETAGILDESPPMMYTEDNENKSTEGTGECAPKPYAKSRPSYGKTQVDDVWNNYKDPTTGKAPDPAGGSI